MTSPMSQSDQNQGANTKSDFGEMFAVHIKYLVANTGTLGKKPSCDLPLNTIALQPQIKTTVLLCVQCKEDH